MMTFHDHDCVSCHTTENLIRLSELGKAVCRGCYPEFFRRRVQSTIRRYQMIRKRQSIAVAFSGGKDSTALLHVLRHARHRLNIRLTALHINMGIAGYSDMVQAHVEEFCRRFNTDLIVEKVADYDINIRPIRTFSICSTCGAVRRALMDRAYAREGWDALATGHTLDDRLQQMLKRLISGRMDAPRPVLPGDGTHPRKIKPLTAIPDRACELYVEIANLPYISEQCPWFVPESHRLKDVFDLLEQMAPLGKNQVANTLGKLMVKPAPAGEELPCPHCGNPTRSGICPLCRLRFEEGNG